MTPVGRCVWAWCLSSDVLGEGAGDMLGEGVGGRGLLQLGETLTLDGCLTLDSRWVLPHHEGVPRWATGRSCTSCATAPYIYIYILPGALQGVARGAG